MWVVVTVSVSIALRCVLQSMDCMITQFDANQPLRILIKIETEIRKNYLQLEIKAAQLINCPIYQFFFHPYMNVSTII